MSDLAAFCEARGIELLARLTADEGEADEYLVRFAPGATPGLISLSGMEQDLAQIAGGRPVRLWTAVEVQGRTVGDILYEAGVD